MRMDKWIGLALVIWGGFVQVSSAVDIDFASLSVESGADCEIATYRIGTNATYNGTSLDLLVDVTSENNILGGTTYCAQLNGGLFEYQMDNGSTTTGTDVYAEFTVTVVEAGTNNPVTVDRLLVTFLDLDSSPNASVGTDDVYLNLAPNSQPFLREGTNVTYSEGSWAANDAASLPPGDTYDVKFKGWGPSQTCTNTQATCFGSAVFENTSRIYFRYQNDSVYQNRGFLLSLEVAEIERIFNNRYDYGDAPTGYGQAGVIATAKYVLGTGLPADTEGSYPATAGADDADPANDPDYDDEGAVQVGGNALEGATLAPGSSYNSTVDIYNEPGNNGYLNAWFDWNGDGDFTDSGEQVISNQQVTASGQSTQNFTLNVPSNAQIGTTYARFTYTQSTRNTPTGTSGGIGEVEGYQFEIAANAQPAAQDDTATTSEDTPVNIDVLNNDSFGGDGAGTGPIVVASNPSHGTATVNDGGTATDPTDDTIDYAPDANYNGTDSFTYTIADLDGDTSTATVNVTINPVNDTPNAVDDTATTSEDTPVNIDVLNNDSFGGDGAGTGPIVVASNPSHGTATVNDGGTATDPTDDTIDYAPDANYNGTDSFTYTIADLDGDTSTATVNVTINPVNDTPNAVDDTATTSEDTPVNIDVLNNDSFGGDGAGTGPIVVASNPSHGTATVNDGGTATDPTDDTIDYAPDANYNGTDSFTYTIEDSNGDTATATVTVTIVPVNDAPVAVDDAASTPMNTPVNINVLTNDSDPENDPLSVTGNTSPSHGTVSFSGGVATYTPANNYTGTDSFDYTISDGNGGTDTATVNITVTNNMPSASNDTATTNEDTPVAIDVLANDTFGTDGPNTGAIVVASNPSHGTATVNDGGTATDPTDDTIDYAPDANYNGTDSFTYTIEDSNGDTATATVTVTIVSVNDPPTAVDNSYTTPQDTPVVINPIDGDSDPDSDPISVTQLNGITLTPGTPQTISVPHGTVGKTAAGSMTFTPTTGYTGASTFPYTISDGNGGTDTANVYITVTPSNGAPVIGIAKRVGTTVDNGNGSYTSSIILTLENLGNVALSNVQVVDDLNSVFPNPVTFSVANVQATGGLTVNVGYDGATDINLLAGTDSLAIGASATVSFDITFRPNGVAGPFNNSATASGQGSGGGSTSDTSDNGTNPDPDGNGNPGGQGENDPTPIDYRGVNGGAAPVPTLGDGAMILLVLLLLGIGAGAARRRLTG